MQYIGASVRVAWRWLLLSIAVVLALALLLVLAAGWGLPKAFDVLFSRLG